MLTSFRRTTWWPLLIVIGLATPATAQPRAWMQTTPRPTVAAMPSPAAVMQPAAVPASAAPTSSSLAPSPQWLPAGGPSLAVTAVPTNPAPVAALKPTATTTVYYPLPSADGAVGDAVPASAITPLAVGTAKAAQPTRSTYAAAYLSAQQPTLAPPQHGPLVIDSTGNSPSAAPAAITSSSPWTVPTPTADTTTIAPEFDPSAMFAADPAWAETAEPYGSWFSFVPRTRASWFLAVSGLVLTRDVPNNVELAYSQAVPQISILNTERAAMDQWVGGVEMRLGRALGDRGAFEFVYWSTETLDERLSVRDENNQINSRLDFQNLSYQGTPLSDIFNDSHEQRLYRTNVFENIELNLLQRAMIVDPTERFGMTAFTGIRYFRFDETLKYDAVAAGAEFADNDPNTQTDYWVREKNRLLGWQLGARWHAQAGRLRIFALPRFGLFGNRIGQQQHACMVLNDHANKTDVTLLGQLDLGLTYHLFSCCSAYVSYRAMAFSGVATADDNYARTFTSPPALDSINSSGSLILHGWQIGGQFQF